MRYDRADHFRECRNAKGATTDAQPTKTQIQAGGAPRPRARLRPARPPPARSDGLSLARRQAEGAGRRPPAPGRRARPERAAPAERRLDAVRRTPADRRRAGPKRRRGRVSRACARRVDPLRHAGQRDRHLPAAGADRRRGRAARAAGSGDRPGLPDPRRRPRDRLRRLVRSGRDGARLRLPAADRLFHARVAFVRPVPPDLQRPVSGGRRLVQPDARHGTGHAGAQRAQLLRGHGRFWRLHLARPVPDRGLSASAQRPLHAVLRHLLPARRRPPVGRRRHPSRAGLPRGGHPAHHRAGILDLLRRRDRGGAVRPQPVPPGIQPPRDQRACPGRLRLHRLCPAAARRKLHRLARRVQAAFAARAALFSLRLRAGLLARPRRGAAAAGRLAGVRRRRRPRYSVQRRLDARNRRAARPVRLRAARLHRSARAGAALYERLPHDRHDEGRADRRRPPEGRVSGQYVA